MSPGREDVESLGERCLREVLVGFVVIVVVVEDILIANKASFYCYFYTQNFFIRSTFISIDFPMTSTDYTQKRFFLSHNKNCFKIIQLI